MAKTAQEQKVARLKILGKAINEIRGENGGRYARLIPELNVNMNAVSEMGVVDNFEPFGNALMVNAGYNVLMNEFITPLMNKIGLTVSIKTIASNPLAMFKKGSLPKGSDVEFIFTNPAKGEDKGATTDANMQKLLKTYKPDTKVTILRTNRGADGLGDVYAVTVDQPSIKRAFQSLSALDDYLNQLVKTLTDGNENDEFDYTKQIISQAVENNYVIIEPIASDLTSEASLKSLSAKLRATYLKMGIPSTKYNAYTHFEDSQGNPVKTASDRDKICVIMTADTAAYMDVGVLANAFNIEKAELKGRVVVIDEFTGNPGIAAIMCDESWLQILQSEYGMEDFRNARTGTTNYFLRVNSIFSILPFANAVAFVVNDEEYLPSIAATAIVPDDLTPTVGQVHNFRLTPANSTETITLNASSTGTVEIDNDNKTFKPLTAGTLILEIDGTPAVNVTVTAS